MKLFKTRHEVKQLRQEVQYLRDMLVAHFGIKYTLDDFASWENRHPSTEPIPVSDGEWWHYGTLMVNPRTETLPAILSFRGRELKIEEKQ